MNDEQHWIVKAGIVTGYVVIAIFCALIIFVVYRGGVHWSSLGGVVVFVAILYAMIRELRAP